MNCHPIAGCRLLGLQSLPTRRYTFLRNLRLKKLPPLRLSKDEGLGATGAATDGEVEDYLLPVRALDFGDLPDTVGGTGAGDYETLEANGGARHIIGPDLRMGLNGPDPDADGQPASGADGDDTDTQGDEEDGVTIPSPITAGQSATFVVEVFNDSAGDATVYGFVDWNNDGDFGDAGESGTQTVGTSSSSQTVNLVFAVPLGASTLRL